ncbi:MAG: amylo-alpha-1,6-glucosidase [Spirochaetales bacterium]|jgi:predicted glycogen debranching enzyme|nr:amylo-alpha-1,6-glucosidase [Spirochaetales bacterium]
MTEPLSPKVPDQNPAVFQSPFEIEAHGDREWLVTNRRGAFASSSIIDCLTRKYHGLLVTPLPGMEGRYVLLSSLEASLKIGGREYLLPVKRFPSLVFPQGSRDLAEFSLLPFPRWTYKLGEARLVKEVFMLPGEAAVFVAFTYFAGEGGPEEQEIEVRPYFSYRNSHHLSRANPAVNPLWTPVPGGLQVNPYQGLPGLAMTFSGEWEAVENFFWEYNIEYAREQERGQDFREDRFSPGLIRVRLLSGRPWVFRGVPAAEADKASPCEEALAKSRGLAPDLDPVKDFAGDPVGFRRRLLTLGGERFFVTNSLGQHSLVAGYPWFGEWGRDTMIALPGLTFCSGREDWGKAVLRDYGSHIKNGLIPNTLGEMQGFTSYNSIDAGLLYLWALGKYLEFLDQGPRREAGAAFFGVADQILSAFLEGRVPNCRLDSQGLLDTGSWKTQLTWMDAIAWGRPVTPRYGYAVELNALFFQALGLYRGLADQTGASGPNREKAEELYRMIPPAFLKTFWLEDLGTLTDTFREGGADRKIRPNMLFAAAAPGLLPKEKGRGVVACAKRELLIPSGLRTLAPGDPEYQGRYEGDGPTRDSRYHQGTAWPWLLGIMVEASLALAEPEELPGELDYWEDYLDSFLRRHLGEQGLGSLSEVFDGDGENPRGKGSFAQAWSVGEVIRAYALIRTRREK